MGWTLDVLSPATKGARCQGSYVYAVSSPPFTLSVNQDALFNARGDISAGEIKIFKDVLSVPGEVHLLVSEKEAEEVFHLTEGDKVEIGPFVVIHLPPTPTPTPPNPCPQQPATRLKRPWVANQPYNRDSGL